MDAIKAGVDKVKEVVHGKKADEEINKAADPTKAPSERFEAAHDAVKHSLKEEKHACKADCHANEHRH